MIDGAIVTRWKKDDPLKPEMFLAKSRGEILEATKSKYCPVSTEKIFKEIKKIKGKIAFVGTPCQIHELKKLENKDREIKDKIIFHFGLFCDRVLDFHFLDYIFSVARVRKEDVVKVTYRSKKWRGWPGDIEIKLKDGTVKDIPREYRMKVKSLFTPDSCFKCKDKLNKLSDIAFGDAWIPEFQSDKLGTSMIISRTDVGDNLLNKAKEDDVIKLDEIEPNKVIVAQKLNKKDKRKTFSAHIKEKIRYIYYRTRGVK